MVKKQIVKQLELPLIEQLKNVDLFDKTNVFQTLPAYLIDNLKHHLRDYQQGALRNLDWTQRQENANYQYNQLLFNMATGSGKTDVMAAIILYMYKEYGYQNFLFIANTDAVVAKTIDNFLNSASTKYLYADPITIDGLHLKINQVNRFPLNPEVGNIYLRLTTIQTLANELNMPHENGLTYEELAQQKLVMLVDEAHHYSAITKHRETKQEQLEHSWENVLDRVRQGNLANRQFEFTATIDLENSAIYEKYHNKIIYRYDLSQFINDRYAKKVYRLQANSNDEDKMLNAILLSQYRKHHAQQLGIHDFKPIILFKSNQIKVSKNAQIKFEKLISNLNVEALTSFLNKEATTTQSEALKIVYAYWQKQNVAATVVELQHDFSAMNIINANDGTKGILTDVSNFHKLNTLEDPNNPFRVIFAVAKLSEGWDVLNLYDIVRIYETEKTSVKQTDSEAQLIGRGARYNPFIYHHKRSYQRRFDDHSLADQLLERLYYHTINEPQYLNNLRKSLDKLNLPVQDDNDFNVYQANIKDSFKRSNAYQHGHVYYNLVENIPVNEYNNLAKYGVNTNSISVINMVGTTLEANYRSQLDVNAVATEHQLVVNFNDEQDLPLIKKAMSRNKFYRFNTLHQYVSLVKSMREFITDDRWLGPVRLHAVVADGHGKLTPQQRVAAISKYLVNIQTKLINNYCKKRGTNQFHAVPINQVVHPYQKKVACEFNQDKFIHELIGSYPMDKKNWYVYDNAIVDKLEKEMIDFIGTFVEQLHQEYDNVYLIRLDEQNSPITLHDFADEVYHYQGYKPDFILYLENANYIYQIYIEPKGDQLLERDQWKEDLLESISPTNINIIGDNDHIRLYGVKFYVSGDGRHIDQELKQKGIISYHPNTDTTLF